ncbi:hypothetical protein QYM36_008746 [Artemia franciscana]|uniref:RNase H type-1 domain-containing protein n=2 Tax=Artemia franciscana TaxID=6661 RepID=A0AA88HPV0_ARTSF|nr:hypothetical protein QYM36_008746 [Artemia franciscana]
MYNIGSYDIPINMKDDGGAIFADDNTAWVMARDTYHIKTLITQVIAKLEKWSKEADLKFSATKTKAIVITRKRIGTLPDLYLSGHPVEYVSEAKILGVVVDNKLTWKPHVMYLKYTCLKRLNVMKSLAYMARGLPAELLIQYYIKYVLPKMEYCSTIYGTACHSTIARLDVIQNSAIRIAFGARKTTPVSFLLSESGLADLETRRKIRFLKYVQRIWSLENNHPVKSKIIKPGRQATANTSKARNQSNCLEAALEICKSYGIDIVLSKMLRVGEIGVPPPWEENRISSRLEFNMDQDTPADLAFCMMMEKEYKGYLPLFTDGSKVDEMKHVGAAFWCPFKNVSKKFKLPPESSVFLAEVYAIKKVLEFIEESVEEDKVIICSDSKSAIQAVVNANTMAKPNRDVLICYIKLQDILKKKKVVIQWIPAHIGISGNEIADLKAKSAVESGTLVTDMDTPYEVMIFDKVIKEIDRQGFKANRDLTGNLFVTMKKQRNIETKVYKGLTRYEAKKLFRLRSHHAGVGCYKAKFLGQSEECPKCGASETIEHLMIICRESEQERREITEFFRQKKVQSSLYMLLGGFDSEEENCMIVSLVIQFLTRIARLKDI